MAQNDAEPFDPLTAAKQAWYDVFRQYAFESLSMMQLIASSLDMQPRDILSDPARLNNTQDENMLEACQASLSGRCTHFAVNTVDELNARHPREFDFKFFDVCRHRMARCEKTGVLIDSSADEAAVVLPDGHPLQNLPGLRGRFGYSSGMLTYEKHSRDGVIKSTVTVPSITATQAKLTCFREVAIQASMLCFFR